MKELNLAYPDKSEIKFRIDHYPDNQHQVTIDILSIYSVGLVTVSDEVNSIWYGDGPSWTEPIVIKSRLNNFIDLELIICATKALRNLGVKEIHLYTPYFLGSRSDRLFKRGSTNYLKDVICPIINSLNFESVTVMDSHSDVLEACLNNFEKEDNLELVEFALSSINPGKQFNLIVVDAGASKRCDLLAQQLSKEYDINLIQCHKKRDTKTGQIEKLEVYSNDLQNLPCIIIDDIADGAASFIYCVKELQKIQNYKNSFLVVSHGIFSKGFSELSKYFDGIYCTNSYGDALAQRDGDMQYQKLVKQLDVF